LKLEPKLFYSPLPSNWS